MAEVNNNDELTQEELRAARRADRQAARAVRQAERAALNIDNNAGSPENIVKRRAVRLERLEQRLLRMDEDVERIAQRKIGVQDRIDELNAEIAESGV